ncbi:MAG: hypothetical protein IJT20_04820 [Synergistaceae bacterium]|nr:hypothetical protein [Synergistaceae bacterium]
MTGAFLSGLTFGLTKVRFIRFFSEVVVVDVDSALSYLSLTDSDIKFLTYDELRNDSNITYATLKERFDGCDDNFFKALMELKELE